MAVAGGNCCQWFKVDGDDCGDGGCFIGTDVDPSVVSMPTPNKVCEMKNGGWAAAMVRAKGNEIESPSFEWLGDKWGGVSECVLYRDNTKSSIRENVCLSWVYCCSCCR